MTDQPTPSLADGYVKWLRAQVGHQLIYLVYASVVVFDDAGRVLVQTRYDFDWWSIPGGAMEPGESLLETARREVLEETGVEPLIKGLAGVLSHPRYNLHYPNGDEVQQWTACFWAEPGPGALRPDGRETLDLFFVEPEAFLARTHPSHAAMVRSALRARAGGPPLLEPAESFPPLRSYYALLRQHVGHAPVILPGCTALVEDGQGRVLMMRNVDFDRWLFPAGCCDLGETTTAAVIREVREETGLEVEPYAIVGLYSDPQWYTYHYPNGDVVHGVGLTFACRPTGGALAPAGNDAEGSAAAFLPIAHLLEGDTDGLVSRILQDYLDRDAWPHIR